MVANVVLVCMLVANASVFYLSSLSIRAKVKSFTTLQDKMATLESNLESLATVLKNRPRHDEKIEELRDKLSAVERHQSSFVDMKAVENLLSIRLPRELHDLEGRTNQSITFVSEKVEAKIQSLEKSLQSQRAESMASLKSELTEDIQRLQASSLRKTDIVSLQNAHAQLKEDLSQLNGYLDRQDKRIHSFKQSSAQVREELADTKQELIKAFHAQQSRVTAMLEDKIAQLSILSKEKNMKVDQQMAILSKKQKKVEENTKVLHDDIVKVRQDVLYKQNATHVAQQKENEKLHQRLVRSVAELETLTFAKLELERRYGKQEKQFQAKLKTLHAKLEENEKLKEFERLELVQRIQEETKLMGIAQGKNALLETLLTKEKLQNAEKNELIHKSRQEMDLVRHKMRSLENEVELKVHKLTTELHSKQVQVDTLVKKLKKSEEEVAKLVESTKRGAKAFRRAKVIKEHELSIAKLKLKEMEKAASAMAEISQPSGMKEGTSRGPDTTTKKSADEAENKRKEMEQLLLESQLQVEELNQEIAEMQKQHDAAKKQQRASLEEQISKLSSEYEVKIVALNATVATKDQTMSRLRDSLVEKSELEVVGEQLRALTDEKKSLLATIGRAHSEQARAIQEHEAKTQLAHDKEMEIMKRNVATRIEELEEARAGLERFKTNISRLEAQLKDQENSHSEELASLMAEIKDIRASIAAGTTEIEELRVEKSQLEQELESVQLELENVRSEAGDREAEMSEKLEAQETEMQSKLDELSIQLQDKETALAESKRADEGNRRKLSEMVSEQEEMERRLKREVESLSLALDHERENSKAREEESKSTMVALQSELDVIKLDSQAAKTSYQSAIATEIADVTSSLKESQRREQQLQERLVSILKEVAQAASAFNADTQVDITGSEDDDAVAVKYLSHFCATQRGTLLELENLQTDYEMAVKQAVEGATTIHELDAQVKAHSTQIQDLQAVVKQLEAELKEQYASSAKESEDLEYEIETLRKQKSDLERLVDSKTSECDEKQALFDRQLESKQDQVEGLRLENEKMSATIKSIRFKMESIEVAKARELDEMSLTLSELEAHAAVHSVKAQGGGVPEFDKDIYANHHEIVALSQSIRSLQLKLTKSVGVLEWNDLKASVFEQEDKLERLRQEKSREVTKIGSAEDEILLNTDFLKAVLALKESNEDDDGSGDWVSKYVKAAPEMVERLRGLESRLQEAMVQRNQQTPTTETGLAAHDVDAMTGNKMPDQVDFQGPKSRVDLSESCESDELLEESHEDLDREHQFDAEQFFDGNLDESGNFSDSAALDESSLDVSTTEAAAEGLSTRAMGGTLSLAFDKAKPSTSDDLERVDSCTTLLLANSAPELLSTAFVASPTRHSAQVPTSLIIGSRHGSDVKPSTHDDEFDDDSREDESEDEECATAELSDRQVEKDGLDDSPQLQKERALHNDGTKVPQTPDATNPVRADSEFVNGNEESSVGMKQAGDDLQQEASEEEERDAEAHSLDSLASVERDRPRDDAVLSSPVQQSSSESSTTPPRDNNPESAPVSTAGEHCNGDTGRSQAALDDEDNDEDHAIDSEEEVEESQYEKPISEVAASADSLKSSDESRTSAPVFNELDDFAEESHGDESADLEDQSREFNSADFDFGVKSEENSTKMNSLSNGGSGTDASSGFGPGRPSTDHFQPVHTDELDQGFQHIESDQEDSEEEGDGCTANMLALDHDDEDEFEGVAQDRGSLRDAGFDSHESDEENLSEFEHFQRQDAASSGEFVSDNATILRTGEEYPTTASPQTYHMEEDEESDDGDVEETERMLLADVLTAEQQLNDSKQFDKEAYSKEAADEDEELDTSAEFEKDDVVKSSSFDKDANIPPSSEALLRDVLDPKREMGREHFSQGSTLESRTEGSKADVSEQYDTPRVLHDDEHRGTSNGFDKDGGDSMDESHEDDAALSDLRELHEGSEVSNSVETQLNLEESAGDHGRNIIDSLVQPADTLRAEQTTAQRMNDQSGESSEQYHSASDIDMSRDEDQSESSFDQVPALNSLNKARTDLTSAQNSATDSFSTSSAAASGSLGGRSALLKHMSFSRTQVENDDDEDLDEVERLMREQSDFALQKPVAVTSIAKVHEERDDEEEANEGERDDELIDSESEEEERPSLDASRDEIANHFDAIEPRSEAGGSSSDGVLREGLHVVNQHEHLPDFRGDTHQRLEESQDDGVDDLESDDQEESLDASQERLDALHESMRDDATSGRSTLGHEALESSFDEQLLNTLETDYEDSARHSDGDAISDSSDSESENGDGHEGSGNEDSVDGKLPSSADQLDSMQTAMRSHDDGEQDIIQQTKLEASARLGQDDNADDDDEFEFRLRRTEPSLPAAPIKLQTSQLAPLVQPSSRMGGAGALKKALSAATRDFDDEGGDDADEVERLMSEQSLSRTSKPAASTLPSASFGKTYHDDSEGEDGFDTESSKKTRLVNSRGGTEDFEKHELGISARDDHDESFAGSQEFKTGSSDKVTRASGGRQGDFVDNSSDEASLDELTSNSAGAEKVVETHAKGEQDTSNDLKKSSLASGDEESDDDDDDDDDIDIRQESPLKPSTLSTRPADTSERKSLGFGLARRVSLEEDDDMDEVECLLLEQTSMKHQPLKQTVSQRVESITGARPSAFDGGADDDDEFGEASIGELMHAQLHDTSPDMRSNAAVQDLDMRHDRSLDESSDSDDDVEDEQSGSLDASQQEASFDAVSPMGQFAANVSMESSFDDEVLKISSKAAPDNHQELRHRVTGGTISDSSDSDDDEEERSASHPSRSPATVPSTAVHSLAPLGLGKKTFGLGFGRQAALEEDDDMDEVERLLLEQTPMKQNVNKRASQATTYHEGADESDDDEFGEESIEALMDEHDHRQQPHSQVINTLKPFEVVEKPQQQERSRPSEFDDDGNGGGDIDNESDDDETSPSRSGSLSIRRELDQVGSAASSPSASSTRIPIFNGSNLADRVATDAIPTMLTQQTSATAVAVESEIQQQLQQLRHDESEDEEEEYLEESFDLEESLQDEDDD